MAAAARRSRSAFMARLRSLILPAMSSFFLCMLALLSSLPLWSFVMLRAHMSPLLDRPLLSCIVTLMSRRLAAVATSMLGVLAAHDLAYRMVYVDAHARAHALEHSGHAWLSLVPLLTVSASAVLLLALMVASRRLPGGFSRALLVSLSVGSFVALETLERLVHGSYHGLVDPASLVAGSALSAAFAYAASLLLPAAERLIGRILSSPSALPALRRPSVSLRLPAHVSSPVLGGLFVSSMSWRGPPSALAEV